MNKFSIISTSLLSLLLLNSCAKKTCTEQDYNGLYNALTCDYESRITQLESGINNQEFSYIHNFNAYQELLAKANNKEEELRLYQNNINALETLVLETENDLEKLNTKQNAKPLLRKIRQQVISMKNKLAVKPPYLKPSKVKQEKKLKKVYQKYDDAYVKNSQVKNNLKEILKNILYKKRADTFTQQDKEDLLLVLKKVRRYYNN